MNVLKLVYLFVLTICISWLIRVVLFKSGWIYMVKKHWKAIQDRCHVYQSFKIPEYNVNMRENQLYRKICLYLHSLPSIEDSDLTNLVTGKKPNDIVLSLDPNQMVEDTFLGARVFWLNQQPQECDPRDNYKSLVLKVRKADKHRILRPYLQHIHSTIEEIERQGKKDLKLHMNIKYGGWKSVGFTHPSTFDTIAMKSDLKNKIKSDLESFQKSKQYYHRIGRIWKRSFLLYGPSGTGKTIFIAALVNFLEYDLYDVDLSKIVDDAELKLLMLQTTSKSIIVIEDLDRFFMEKTTGLTSTGKLNFMDGLLNSCCVEERIMVFTMNSKENVDPAMLRPGRVDVHIHFPLCDFAVFKDLAKNYLGVKEHKLFPQVQEMFETGASLSPAEIGELMIVNRTSPSRALKSVISALQTDGDGSGAVKIGRILADQSGTGESTGSGSGCGSCSEGLHAVRDFRNLYGFLRIKRSRVKSTSFDGSPSEKQRSR